MAQAVPFPAEFTQTAIVELNNNFLLPIPTGGFKLQAFIETGSGDPHAIATLVSVADITIGSVVAEAIGDSSGDLGLLVTITLPDATATIPGPFVCKILLLQKGAARYQDPRRFS